jgi:hypothetical protein
MNNHTITIKGVSSYSNITPAQHYQAKCSCDWMSNQAWLEATVRRVAQYHMSGCP